MNWKPFNRFWLSENHGLQYIGLSCFCELELKILFPGLLKLAVKE